MGYSLSFEGHYLLLIGLKGNFLGSVRHRTGLDVFSRFEGDCLRLESHSLDSRIVFLSIPEDHTLCF